MNTEYVSGDTLFTKSENTFKQMPYLTQDISTDIIIVGGGVTGAILAYYFTKNNIDCVLLEKSRIGHCSTSITTSLLQYELDSTVEQLKEYTSIDNIIQSYRLGQTALRELNDFIIEYGNICDYEVKDTLLYTTKNIEKKIIEHEYNTRKQYGFDVSFIDDSSDSFCFDVKAGVYSNVGGAQLDPYKYTHHLLDVSMDRGLKAYENTEVIGVEHLSDSVIAQTTYGHKVFGKKLIVCTGYNTKLFTDRNFATDAITYNIVTKPINTVLNWKNTCLTRDTSDPYIYLRTTKDNRIIIGGEDTVGLEDINNKKLQNKKFDLLEHRLNNMFKDKSIDIEYRYCGVFKSTNDNLGFIGVETKHKNLWYCLGYGANGLLFAILGGMMLTKLYRGEYDDNLKLFKPDRFDN